MDKYSFMVHVISEDVYADLDWNFETRFGTSNCKVKRPLPTGKNKKVIGLMKDEVQGSAVTTKLSYVIMYMCQNFDVHEVHLQIPKNMYQASYLLPSDFPNSFS